MSLDKAIAHKKEYRSPYRGGKAFSKQCCNHGSCSWCKGNRTYQTSKTKSAAKQRIKEYQKFDNDSE